MLAAQKIGIDKCSNKLFSCAYKNDTMTIKPKMTSDAQVQTDFDTCHHCADTVRPRTPRPRPTHAGRHTWRRPGRLPVRRRHHASGSARSPARSLVLDHRGAQPGMQRQFHAAATVVVRNT
jgi:hypothetical protein